MPLQYGMLVALYICESLILRSNPKTPLLVQQGCFFLDCGPFRKEFFPHTTDSGAEHATNLL